MGMRSKGLTKMSENDLSILFERVRQNMDRLVGLEETPISDSKIFKKSPGVYMLFFEDGLQYVGSSGNLRRRIITNLLAGNEKSHTLINKLCILRKISVANAKKLLKENSKIKSITTETEDDARILEDVLIALHHPIFNEPLRRLKKTADMKENNKFQSQLF